MANKENFCIRFEPLLMAQCKLKAAEQDIKVSEWMRRIVRREVGLEKRRNGRAK